MNWQPIETAPKDGQPLLLLVEGSAIQGLWLVDRWNPDGKWDVLFLDLHGCGCCAGGDANPSHWQPLSLPEKE